MVSLRAPAMELTESDAHGIRNVTDVHIRVSMRTSGYVAVYLDIKAATFEARWTTPFWSAVLDYRRTAIMQLVQQAWEAHPLPPPRWQDVSSDVARDGLPVAARFQLHVRPAPLT
jgi:hypothetical protein